MIYVYPYKKGSQSLKNLKQVTGEVRLIKTENSKFKGKGKKVINWGSTNLPQEVLEAEVVNKPEAVKLASNKKSFFDKVKGIVKIPEYTDNKEEALEWINDGKTVVVREQLTGHSGKGIVVLETPQEWEEYKHNKSKLYVKYIPKKDEYRVHVNDGKVIDVQRKAIQKGLNKELIDFKIRNHKNGFVFVRGGVEAPQKVLDQAVLAVEQVGLDFGAVDVIFNTFQDEAYVLEINTAPGLEGTTLKNYAEEVFEVKGVDWDTIFQLNAEPKYVHKFNINIGDEEEEF